MYFVPALTDHSPPSACRKISDSRDPLNKEDSPGLRSQLSSAKLALQGVITKARGFGLTSSSEIEQMVEMMEEERELLLTAISKLNSKSLPT